MSFKWKVEDLRINFREFGFFLYSLYQIFKGGVYDNDR